MYGYNGHPSAENNKKALKVKGIKNVVIVGNGNVAIDVARIFLRKPQDFKASEMAEEALQELMEHKKIRTVEILGRRGVTHSAFSIKEIRELERLGIKMYAVRE